MHHMQWWWQKRKFVVITCFSFMVSTVHNPFKAGNSHLTCSPTKQHRTDKDKLTQTHTSHKSHLQVGQQGRSLSSPGLYQPPIGCGYSPSKGHNGPSGRSGCCWNSLVGPAPPKTLSPCPTPSGSPQQWPQKRPAWSFPPGCHSSCGFVSVPYQLSFHPNLHLVQALQHRSGPPHPAAQRSWTTYF